MTVWTVKGGSGASVVAAALALLRAEREGGALLVDRAGDQPAVLGAAEPSGPGVADWLRSGRDPAALRRLELALPGGIALLPSGGAGPEPPGDPTAEADLADALTADRRPVVVDAGLRWPDPAGEPSDGTADPVGVHPPDADATRTSVLVVRPCYLALRRAARAGVRADAVVLVREVGRALDRRDVERVLDTPVRAVVDVDPVVARAVDAGLLATRLPSGLRRSLGRLL